MFADTALLLAPVIVAARIDAGRVLNLRHAAAWQNCSRMVEKIANGQYDHALPMHKPASGT
jgi:hypothetical protein